MKLGELRALIRKTKGNPTINICVGNATEPMRIAVQKASLLSELERIYPGGKNAETGHTFDEATGVLTAPGFDERPVAAEIPASAPGDEIFATALTASWSDIETMLRNGSVQALNIHCKPDGFQVQIRRRGGYGFDCAQRTHPSLEAAVREHFRSDTDLSDLL